MDLFHHLAPLIVPLSCVLDLTVISLLPVSLVLGFLRLEFVYTELWHPLESLLDKFCPLNV